MFVAAVAAVSGAAVSGVAVSGVAGVAVSVAVSGVAGVAVSAAAAQAGERAAFAKLHDLADERQNLTNCRAGISARRVGDDLGMGEEIGHFLPTADAERAMPQP
jgi:hypothetical protein